MIRQVHLVEDHIEGRKNNNIQAHHVDSQRNRLKIQQTFNLTLSLPRERIGEARIARAQFIHNLDRGVNRNIWN